MADTNRGRDMPKDKFGLNLTDAERKAMQNKAKQEAWLKAKAKVQKQIAKVNKEATTMRLFDISAIDVSAKNILKKSKAKQKLLQDAEKYGIEIPKPALRILVPPAEPNPEVGKVNDDIPF